MTALTIREATAKALARVRAGQTVQQGQAPRHPQYRSYGTSAPVRRDSREAGTFENLFFATPERGEPDRMVRAVRAALDQGRRLKRAARAEGRQLSITERALAGLTASAIRVFEELCMLARLNRGRVFPSYDRLAEMTALGRATIARAIAQLETAGFLLRQRRFKRIEGEGSAPRYAQTSNVYRPLLPRQLIQILPRWPKPTPLPCDVEQHIVDRRADVAAMETTLSARELALTTTDGALGRMLARLGAAIDVIDTEKRESHNRPGSQSNYIRPRKMERCSLPVTPLP